MKILGLNVFHADTAACLIVDGKIIAAVEEERFTRIKHFTGFPKNSIDFCLKEYNIDISEVDAICVNFNKNYNFKEKFLFSLKNFNSINFYRKAFFSLKKNSLNKLFKKFYKEENIIDKVINVPHHLAHICSTYLYNDIKEESIGFSYDGSGDFSTVEIYKLGAKIELLEKTNYPHSFGVFYQAFTQFLGFKNYGDEYKVMGLASYGDPIYKDRIKKIIQNENNFLELNLDYFDHHQTVIDYDFDSGYPFFDDLYSSKFEQLFGKSRGINEPILKMHKDLASSLQTAFEEIILEKLQSLHKKYKVDNLCLSGGCTFNSSLNGKIIKYSNFKKVYFSPNVGDAGGAMGAALYYAKKKGEKIVFNADPYIGTSYDDKFVEEKIIEKIKNIDHIQFKYFDDFEELCKKTLEVVTDNGVVGWFQDKMEWGPRALGNRSIICDPRNPMMRDIINIKIKKREEFRPFAPVVLEEKAKDYFDISDKSEFMCAVFEAKNKIKDIIPAVVHVDNTSRVQTVSEQSNKKLFTLIKEFEKLTSIPILLNTSLNINEPICENPENALEIFTKTSMDAIVIQNWLLTKKK